MKKLIVVIFILFCFSGTAFGALSYTEAQIDALLGIVNTGTTPGKAIFGGATYAAIRQFLDLEVGTDFYSIAAADTAHEAELTNSAGLLAALSDEEGTGVAVFNGSPTFTGDVILPSSNADNAATAGALRHDSTVANHAYGALRWYDGNAIQQIIHMDAILAQNCGDTEVVTYDAGNDWFECSAAGAGDITSAGDCATAACTADAILDDEDISPTGGTWTLADLTLLTMPAAWTGTPSATPGTVFLDSGNPGADFEIAKIYAEFISGADGAEIGDLYFQTMVGGTEATFITLNGTTERVDIAKPIVAKPAFQTDAAGAITLTVNAVNYGTDTGKANIPDGACDAAADVGNWVVLISSAADVYQMTSDDESNQFIIAANAAALTANDELDVDGTMVAVMCIAAELWKVTGYMGAIPTDGGAP